MNMSQSRPHRCHAPEFFRLRSMCTRFPHAEEIDEGSVGEPEPVYKVDGRIFAMQHRVDDRVSVWCRAATGVQELLVTGDPRRFFAPPYVGHRGWIGIWLDGTPDWAGIEALIEDSYRRTAPEGLVAGLTTSAEVHHDVPSAFAGNQAECPL